MAELFDQYLGDFVVEGQQLPGQVTLKGKDSKFEIFSDLPIALHKDKMRTIRGVARSGEKITICDAIGAEVSGSRHYYGTSKHFMSLFPHHVAVGPRHIDTQKNVISEISFTTTGAISLFYDLGAFGSAHRKDVRRLMPAWAKKDRRKIRYSHISYYADRGPMVSIKINSTEITVYNAATLRFPSAEGINLENEVRISLKFEKAKNLRDAMSAMFEFRAFCEVVSQTKQCIKKVFVHHKDADAQETRIALISSHEETKPGRETDFRDNLVSGGLNRQEFATVLANWLGGQLERRMARQRIVQGIRSEIYTIDRLIGAANAFDLLPDPADKKKLPKAVLDTLATLTNHAQALNPPYKEQVLNSLGRIKGSTLRKKVEARFHSLPLGLREKLPEMIFVIDHCIRTRNYFVHGSPAKLSVEAIESQIYFLTDTLEFIFVASELSMCGWRFKRWLEQANTGRFRDYVRLYDLALAEFKCSAASKATKATMET